VTQSVKEVLQSLVDDRLVNAEKIGTSNYFWSFPSTAMQSRQNSRTALQEELQRLRGLRESVEEQLETAMQARKETLERCELLKRHGELEGEFAACSAKLEVHRANDPKLLAQKRIAANTATSAANRWTDNIFTLQSFCANNFSIPRSQFNEQFGLPDDFDYIQI
jgi:ABC-type phosphate transport system auxiliary subunit